MDTYGIERGDVLLSLQVVLTREEERSGGHQVVRPVPRGGPAPVPPESSRQRSHMAAMVPATRSPLTSPATVSAPVSPVSLPVAMVDADTGAGSLHALRRDLRMSSAWDQGPDSAVVAVDVQGIDQIRLVLGPQSVEEVMKGLVEVAPFTLGTHDRVYRSARDQLILLLAGAGDGEIEAARSRLETGICRFLSDRGFPEVTLAARRIDPAALAG